MINTEAFTKRLQQVIDYYGESASSFAEKIGVQRSSISHILSGRNKPSLEFVLKILSTFPEVELYWLLNGKGEFPATKKTIVQNTIPFTSSEAPPPSPIIEKEIASEITQDKTIERIVIFYSDGSFKNFQN
ncbi:DNA-binding XRE family transcriptional regulator [Mariniflexile fucanivorans]|uniref:DNA-binding XRE family transcriptional regulator n=1 Tax=Mariniflexile fucanivorans TaxID=264023 RepID=A0A4R1RFX5_9FLAO|nr:helix-turn-helix transcriptional regulator [Mariniflexile fucanivorans]TCL64851.1 DNA-binding XRE family transcriptional regulator [Mariniflexile fucanivorans]